MHSSNPGDILASLLEGNVRFATGCPAKRIYTDTDRYHLLKKQQPKAVVLACSDSRVAPEIIFDAALGDLFVVRTAGNLADPLVVESIGYGINRLNTDLLIVLGHTCCGAVTEAVTRPPISTENSQIVDRLKPAIARSHQYDNDIILGTVMANVHQTVDTLAMAPHLLPAVKANRVHIQGALYHLEDGMVQLLNKGQTAEIDGYTSV